MLYNLSKSRSKHLYSPFSKLLRMKERRSVLLAVIFSDNRNFLMSCSYFVITLAPPGGWRASPVSDYEYGIGLYGLRRPHSEFLLSPLTYWSPFAVFSIICSHNLPSVCRSHSNFPPRPNDLIFMLILALLLICSHQAQTCTDAEGVQE